MVLLYIINSFAIKKSLSNSLSQALYQSVYGMQSSWYDFLTIHYT